MTRSSKYVPADVRHGQALSEEARQAIIEQRRLMRDQRAWERANRARLDAEWNALSCPPRTIAEHIGTGS